MAESLAVKPATQENQLYHVLLVITVSELIYWYIAIISGIYLTKFDQNTELTILLDYSYKYISYGSLRQ